MLSQDHVEKFRVLVGREGDEVDALIAHDKEVKEAGRVLTAEEKEVRTRKLQ